MHPAITFSIIGVTLFGATKAAVAEVTAGDLLAIVSGRGGACLQSDAIVKVDKSTGAMVTISGCDDTTGLLVGSGPKLLFDSSRVGLVSDGDLIFAEVIGSNLHRIFRVDPDTGDRIELNAPLVRGGTLAIVPMPVPEPSASLMLSSGAALAVAMSRANAGR